MVKSVNSKEEYDQLLNDSGNRLIVVDFYATWCGPCKLMGPKFEKMSEEFKDVIFIKIDVDEPAVEDVVDSFEVKVMPTFVLMKAKQQINQFEGNCADALKASIAENQ